MHLATYNIRGRLSFGVVSGDGVVDLRPRLAPRLTIGPGCAARGRA